MELSLHFISDGGWEFGIEELSPSATLYIIFTNFMKDWRDNIYLM